MTKSSILSTDLYFPPAAVQGMKSSVDAAGALAARDKVSRLLVAARDEDPRGLKEAAAAFDEGQGVAKAVLDVKDANGRGALHFAAQNGNDAVCQYLLEELSFPVDLRDNDGETPLIHAARQGHFQTAMCLLEHGADPGAKANELDATALHHAAGAGSAEIVQLLLERGADVNVPSDAGPPLIWAAGHDRFDVVKLLLDHGADPNSSTDDDVTALIAAAAAGACAIVDLLVAEKASVNISAGGATPLHIAADFGNDKMVNSLLKAGANADALDDDGMKPIMAAALKGNKEIVSALLPVTTPDPKISDWSYSGVLSYAQHLNMDEQEKEKHTNADKSEIDSKLVPVEVSSEKKEKSLQAKARGDEEYKNKNFMSAVDAYTQALEFDPYNATVLSNRSLCWMRVGQPEQALTDAKLVRQLFPDWVKGCYREGSALRLLQRYEEAANAFYEGVKLDPNNKELVNAFREAVEAGKRFYEALDRELKPVSSYLFKMMVMSDDATPAKACITKRGKEIVIVRLCTMIKRQKGKLFFHQCVDSHLKVDLLELHVFYHLC
ncbi:hypothetical protein GOP47_0013723 [Adiantum capillus-veneris]|uniref:Serine/threonine-protein kinase BSK1-like TPR repeats domain-containing protein n=1 Tax=Adiantum capillus-veneris TaxID=13818 RepID=A0A9D4UQ13_ADICA|nr:hypothetical protein GOP47_0013723 [Adiantum capillus-veneris]